MSSSSAADKETSPSPAKSTQTPPRPATESSPRLRPLNVSPRVNTSPQRPHLITTPPPQPPVRGAETTPTIFAPPQPQWPLFHFRPIVYPSAFGQGSYYFHPSATALVPAVGSSSGGVVAQGSPVGQKRKYKEGSASPGAGRGRGRGQESPSGTPVNCSVCNKEFSSQKALFGHMRSHPDRGWKGAHPPPTFSAEEEFADLADVNLQALADAAVGELAQGEVEPGTGNDGGVEEGEIVEQAEGQVVEPEGGQQEAENEEMVAPPQVAGEAGAEPVYLLPDLNEIPPPEDE